MKGGHMRGKRLVGHRGLGRRLPPSVCIYNTLWVGRYESHRLSCRSERDDDILTAGLTEEPKCQCGTGRSITLVPTEINVWFVTYFNNCSTDWRDICLFLTLRGGWTLLIGCRVSITLIMIKPVQVKLCVCLWGNVLRCSHSLCSALNDVSAPFLSSEMNGQTSVR